MTNLLDVAINGWLIAIPPVLIVLAIVRWKLAITVGLAGAVIAVALIATEPDLEIPVTGATSADWHPENFLHEPWGSSIVHRGIDIFADSGIDVVAPTNLLVIASGTDPKSGVYAVGVDRALRLHFFAHMSDTEVEVLDLVSENGPIGSVGDTGNAKGKPPHLHYGLASTIPRPWKMTDETLGHLKAFYLNPAAYFR